MGRKPASKIIKEFGNLISPQKISAFKSSGEVKPRGNALVER